MTDWGARAAGLYDDAYAGRYRQHDDELAGSAPSMALAAWLGAVCERCGRDLSVLDLGCGTGRYFWALQGVADLVGLDASPAMLARARHPHFANRVTAARTTLVEGDLLTVTFEPGRFDLVYSIGVLAEHAPLTPEVVALVARWLKPAGRFAFTSVRPDSPSVPKTLGRRVGTALAPVLRGKARRVVRDRLMSGGLYADEVRVRELLAGAFVVESLEPFESEAHLHCLCVARRSDAR